MRILVTGAFGQLGSEIKGIAGKKDYASQHEMLFADAQDCDLTRAEQIEKIVSDFRPDLVLHNAAYTAVDRAEDEPELAKKINSVACSVLAKSCEQLDNSCKIIGISTDFVFDGTKSTPYFSEDEPNPLNVYGATKYQGEVELLKNPNSIVIRTSWVYSVFGNNFVKTMRKFFSEREKLTIVYDQVGTPTAAKDLGVLLTSLIDEPERLKILCDDVSRIFHFSNEGVASWYDFARAIQHYSTDITTPCKVLPILSSEFVQKAIRPKFSVLDKSKIKKILEIEIPYWQDSLVEVIRELKEGIK